MSGVTAGRQAWACNLTAKRPRPAPAGRCTRRRGHPHLPGTRGGTRGGTRSGTWTFPLRAPKTAAAGPSARSCRPRYPGPRPRPPGPGGAPAPLPLRRAGRQPDAGPGRWAGAHVHPARSPQTLSVGQWLPTVYSGAVAQLGCWAGVGLDKKDPNLRHSHLGISDVIRARFSWNAPL